MLNTEEMDDLHTKMSLLAAIDVGIVVIDRNFTVSLWNEFMANHSGKRASEVQQQSLFQVAPEIDQDWFLRKAERTFQLGSRAFIIWEQRPYLFQFSSYRPVTGASTYMYQNVTLLPLTNARGQVEHLGIIVYDVTDMAESALAEAKLRERMNKQTNWNTF
ncbi:hypothetical protein CWE15_06050 [Aliidiomarina taiwanensis]|uniref:PAS domain-containing protein n=1 Tax=Aliidiomarina taiwanensis TaxID=946228 RepID=A0A432X7Z7_9GAMM|nr:PAS domain-containing protein [Aliidiomarina taiwanensis]RUO42962.1 hypothetical protein CWE15_06050 [Aliidiomarina taiwanensis]